MSTQNCPIMETLRRCCNSGDAYVPYAVLWRRVSKTYPSITLEQYESIFRDAVLTCKVILDGGRVYPVEIWENEEAAAKHLSRILSAPPLPVLLLPENVSTGNVALDDHQIAAIRMTLSNRLSCILCGADSNKTMLVQGLLQSSGISEEECLLLAPTGKAAQILGSKAGIPAMTIDLAVTLDKKTDSESARLKSKKLILVDEANMMSLSHVSRLLGSVDDDCRIVLIGDPNQLPSVNAGNVLTDFRSLDVPFYELRANHRQSFNASALYSNVTQFDRLRSIQDLRFDDSFELRSISPILITDQLKSNVLRCQMLGESVQVLSPRKDVVPLSVSKLNPVLRDALNPEISGKPELPYKGIRFRDGDIVMLCRNDYTHRCINGDIGVFHTLGGSSGFSVSLQDGSNLCWEDEEADMGLSLLSHAYAITVHKSMGLHFDTVLLVLPDDFSTMRMITRNLLYTAISRAAKRVVIYGSADTLDRAMRSSPPPRLSRLPEKVRMLRNVSA